MIPLGVDRVPSLGYYDKKKLIPETKVHSHCDPIGEYHSNVGFRNIILMHTTKYDFLYTNYKRLFCVIYIYICANILGVVLVGDATPECHVAFSRDAKRTLLR